MKNDADHLSPKNDLDSKPSAQDHLNEDILEPADPIEAIPNGNELLTSKHQLRFQLLAVLASGSLLILGRSLFDGNIGKPTPFTFPNQIEFGQAPTQILMVKPPEPIVDSKNFFGKPRFLSGNRYKYLIDSLPMDIDLRYAVGTEGELRVFLKELADIEISEDQILQKSVRKDPVGYHLIFDHQDRTYLTACINPRGISTVTKEQFDDNASNQVMNRDVIIGWLLGQSDLRDRRCLWTLISTPSTSSSDRNTINQKLEKTWILWYEWWKPRFPTP
ncbi:cyanoexosortase A system-associated protein [Pseudanabaena biceps]|nr:cyanoexosortase A system-associated protein [Pseudanabaena biceps]